MKKSSLFFMLSVSALAQAIDLNPLHWLADFKAATAFKQADYERAKTELVKLLDHADGNPAAVFNAGNLSYATKDWQKAAAYFDAAAQHEHASPELKKQAHFNHGNALTQADQLEAALDAYKKVHELDPAHEKAQMMIEQIERELKKRKEQQSPDNQKNDSSKNQDNKNKQQEKKDNDQQDDQSKDESNKQSSNDTKNDRRDEDQPEDNGGENKKDQSKERKKAGDERDEQRGDEREKKEGDKPQKGDTQDQQETGAGNQRDEKKQEPFNQGPPEPQEEKQHHKQEPHDSSPDTSSQNDSHSTDNARKIKASDSLPMQQTDQQPTDERFSPADQQLMKLLDQHDAQALKQLLKVDIKKNMQGHHGQKNW